MNMNKVRIKKQKITQLTTPPILDPNPHLVNLHQFVTDPSQNYSHFP